MVGKRCPFAANTRNTGVSLVHGMARITRHDGVSYRGVADDDDIALLEVAFGRGREGACAKKAEQIGLYRAGQVLSMRTMASNFFQFAQPRQFGINLKFRAKALEQRRVYCL